MCDVDVVAWMGRWCWLANDQRSKAVVNNKEGEGEGEDDDLTSLPPIRGRRGIEDLTILPQPPTTNYTGPIQRHLLKK